MLAQYYIGIPCIQIYTFLTTYTFKNNTSVLAAKILKCSDVFDHKVRFDHKVWQVCLLFWCSSQTVWLYIWSKIWPCIKRVCSRTSWYTVRITWSALVLTRSTLITTWSTIISIWSTIISIWSTVRTTWSTVTTCMVYIKNNMVHSKNMVHIKNNMVINKDIV